MKSNSEMIEEVIKDGELMEGCKSITKNAYYTEDLFNDVILKFLNRPVKKNYDLYKKGKLKGFIYISIKNKYIDDYCRGSKNKLKSDIDISSIDLYDNYNEGLCSSIISYSDELDTTEYHFKLEVIEEILNNPNNWHDMYEAHYKRVFEMYYKIGEFNITDGANRDKNCKRTWTSTRAIERRIGVDHNSVAKIITLVDKRIKEILREKQIL